jgi:aminopeptidase N
LKQVYNILGYDTISKGLKIYFDRHQWGSTELPDFVGALEEAWQASGNQSMGSDFNLTNWCDTWLKSSGINILEPIVELNADGTLKSLQVNQSNGLRGQNRLRKQKISIAIYEKALSKGDMPFVIENVVISEH